jgi:hypothetical protein
MTRILTIAILMLLISCSDLSKDKKINQLPEDAKNVQVELIDSLGMVTLSLPMRYDTGFSWVHYSDCGKPCDEQKYRFQPKELPIIKESGWVWSEPKDSVERFTISHKMDFPFHDGDTARNMVRHNHIIEQLKSNPQNPPIVFDTIQKIDGRYYSIIVMDKSDSMQSKKVLAVTTIKNNEVKFQYELLTRKNDLTERDFIKNSIDFIKTIHISKGL